MTLTFESGKVLEHPVLNNMVRAMNGDGVLSDPDATSLEVIARSTPIMGVQVRIGNCRIADTIESEAAATNLTIEAAHATDERKDLITYDATANTPAIIKGTDHAGTAADPTYPPDIPDGDILLGIVKVDAATTTIVTDNITDGRIIVGQIRMYSGASAFSGNSPTSWTDLDLSSIVGSNRAEVMLKVKNTQTAPGSMNYAFRPNGDSDEYYYRAAGELSPSNFIIGDEKATLTTVLTDSSGIIEWMTYQVTPTTIYVMSYVQI